MRGSFSPPLIGIWFRDFVLHVQRERELFFGIIVACRGCSSDGDIEEGDANAFTGGFAGQEVGFAPDGGVAFVLGGGGEVQAGGQEDAVLAVVLLEGVDSLRKGMYLVGATGILEQGVLVGLLRLQVAEDYAGGAIPGAGTVQVLEDLLENRHNGLWGMYAVGHPNGAGCALVVFGAQIDRNVAGSHMVPSELDAG